MTEHIESDNFNKDEVSNREITSVDREAPNPINLFLSFPTELFVQCNLVAPMIVGEKSMRAIEYVSLVGKLTDYIMSFDIKDTNFSPVILESFDTIEIIITDRYGNLVPFDAFGSPATVINLLFEHE